MREEQRESWGSRPAFVLAAIGSAVGLLVISVLLFLLADGSPPYYPRIDVPVTAFTLLLAVVMGVLVVAPALAPAHRPSGGESRE